MCCLLPRAAQSPGGAACLCPRVAEGFRSRRRDSRRAPMSSAAPARLGLWRTESCRLNARMAGPIRLAQWPCLPVSGRRAGPVWRGSAASRGLSSMRTPPRRLAAACPAETTLLNGAALAIGPGAPTALEGFRRVVHLQRPGPERGHGLQECSSAGRASVSKTESRGFESPHSCHYMFSRGPVPDLSF